MKNIYLIFICIVIGIMQLNAQELGDGLLFSQFERGLIKYRNNTQREAILNYNTIEQEFLFLSSDSTVMAIGEPQSIDMIVIGRRSFIPAEKDMFYEMLRAGNTNFFVQWQSKFVSQGKRTAYGGYSGASAISNVTISRGGSTGSSGGVGLYGRLISDEKFKANTDCIYHVIVDSKYRKFNSLKSFVKIFKKYENQIKTFSEQHTINFSNPDEVAKLVEYVYSL